MVVRALTIIVLVAMWSGCSRPAAAPKDRAVVSGKVTFSGQPLPAGTITFKSTTGAISTSTSINSGGFYSTDRAPLGKNLVMIDTSSIQYGNPAAYVPIPAKYGDASASRLSVEVQAGTNDNVDFALEK